MTSTVVKGARTATARWRMLAVERFRLLALLHGDRGPLAVLLSSHTAAALAPAAIALCGGWLVSRISDVSALGAPPSTLALPLTAIAALLLVEQAALSVRGDVEFLVAGRIDGRIRGEVRRLATRPLGVEHLARTDVAALVSRASDIGHGARRSPGRAATGQLTLTFRLVAALASAAVVAQVSPPLAAGLLLASLLMRATIRRQWLRLAHADTERQPHLDRVRYWDRLGSQGAAAKEIRLFGLSRWLTSVRVDEERRWSEPLRALRLSILSRQHWIYLLGFGAGAAALLVPGLTVLGTDLPHSALFSCVVAAFAVLQMGAMGIEAFDIEYGRAAVGALDSLRARFPTDQEHPAPTPDTAVPSPPRIQVRDLTFTYPGGEEKVFDGLDLDIRPGEVLAVVGRNGAGKTTLITMLGGLIEPDAGVVSVGGTPLPALDPTHWRRRIAVVFQSANRYPLTLADNIALGAPEHRDDRAGITRVAAATGVDAIARALPLGLDTPMSRDLTDGRDLSGGQWQKVALARAMFAVHHGRDLLMLDEPTAHLDVRTEIDFHRQVRDLARGVSVLIVSHRMSTVRHADRIVLLRDGRVAEEGSHDELLALGGEYHDFHRLQTARFAENPPSTAGNDAEGVGT
ncbi:hypothetical protein C1701_23920 [Actinoalloteichus sp. AHMU CJ021]|uniref:ATP-binding cassette domain-containing protein n=1 Tax=Actinoalloteichus TaxID=65496 RepID=UPI000CA036C6|nr:hypothetical protein C1701_23920 [Actinoalloteichus sp. AHMU CJ021]